MKQNNLPQHPVLDYFYEICKIPHTTYHESALAKFLLNKFIQLNAKDAHIDKYDNVIAHFKATSKLCKHTITLQAHSDMVAAKKHSSKHDFLKDPIQLIKKGDFIYANDTTLGADDGIGIATILAIVSNKKIKHGPIEVIITCDEEETKKGAINIDKSNLLGEYLINLDHSDDKTIVIGSGSQIKYLCEIPFHWSTSPYKEIISISLKGLSGGHSAFCINKQDIIRNAIKEIFNELFSLSKNIKFNLIDLHGGESSNSLPTSCEILITTDNKNIKAFHDCFNKLFNYLKKQYPNEKDIVFNFKKIHKDKIKCISDTDTIKIINVITALYTGVTSYDDKFNALKASANLGMIYLSKDSSNVIFSYEVRNMSEIENEKQGNVILALANMFNFKYQKVKIANAWEPIFENNVLCDMLLKIDPQCKPIYCFARLEVANLMEAKNFKQAISIGPNIYDEHSPNEHLSISSTKHFFNNVCKLLENIK